MPRRRFEINEGLVIRDSSNNSIFETDNNDIIINRHIQLEQGKELNFTGSANFFNGIEEPTQSFGLDKEEGSLYLRADPINSIYGLYQKRGNNWIDISASKEEEITNFNIEQINVGDSINNYTGSLTVFDTTFDLNDGAYFVYVDGILMAGNNFDYNKTGLRQITFNYALEAGSNIVIQAIESTPPLSGKPLYWSSSLTYHLNELVAYDGKLYFSLTNDNTNNRPDISPINWSEYLHGVNNNFVEASFFVNEKTINQNTTIPTNKNAMMSGPINILNGVTLTIEDGATLVII